MERRKRTHEQMEQQHATQEAEIKTLQARVKALEEQISDDKAWQEKQRAKRHERDKEDRKLARYAEGRVEVMQARLRRMRKKYTGLLREIGSAPGLNSTSSSHTSSQESE
jgi:multidrug resistance efflux pump